MPKHVRDAIKQLENPSLSALILFPLTVVTMDLSRMLFCQRLLRELGSWIFILILNVMGGACSTYEGEERCIQGFGGET